MELPLRTVALVRSRTEQSSGKDEISERAAAPAPMTITDGLDKIDPLSSSDMFTKECLQINVQVS